MSPRKVERFVDSSIGTDAPNPDHRIRPVKVSVTVPAFCTPCTTPAETLVLVAEMH